MKNTEKLAEIAARLPDEIRQGCIDLVEKMGAVIEGIGDRPIEWKPPFLKVVQGTTAQDNLPEGAGIGSMVLGENLLTSPKKVIPIRSWTGRQLWDQDLDNPRMVCSSPDGKAGFKYGNCNTCQYKDFLDNKPQCNKIITVLCATGDLDEVFTANFAKTNYTEGTEWQTLMRKANTDPHKRFYELKTVTSAKNRNVKLLKATPVTSGSNRVEAVVLEFVAELARLSGTDRTEMLKAFHENVTERLARASAPALENSVNGGADMVLLATDVVEAPADAVVLEATDDNPLNDVVETPKPKKGGKQYSI